MRMRLLHRGSNRVTEWKNYDAGRNQSETLAVSYQRLISKLLNSRGASSITEGEKRFRTSRRMPLERARLTYRLDPRARARGFWYKGLGENQAGPQGRSGLLLAQGYNARTTYKIYRDKS